MVESDKLRRLWDSDSSIPPECRDAIGARLNAVLQSWVGTPWLGSSSVKGRGADCLGFVSRVYDELYRKEFGLLTVPSPVGLSYEHAKFLEFYSRAHRIWPVKRNKTVDMGDLILDRRETGHAHLFICGSVPYTVWHCLAGHGVCFSGFSSLGNNLTFFKMRDKETWI